MCEGSALGAGSVLLKGQKVPSGELWAGAPGVCCCCRRSSHLIPHFPSQVRSPADGNGAGRGVAKCGNVLQQRGAEAQARCDGSEVCGCVLTHKKQGRA